jgi:Spy/CpxP family protein refolding chaperone
MRPYTRFRHWTRRLPVVLILLLGLGLVGCDSNSSADDPASTAPAATAKSADETAAALSTSLSLSPDQSTALQEALSARDADAPGALWGVAADLHDQLTPEQIDQLTATVQERRAARHREGSRKGPRKKHRAQRRQRMADALGLTDAQRTALADVRAQYRDQLTDLHDQRRAGTFDEADAEEWRTLRAEMRAAMTDVLTPEQRDQLEARRDAHRERREAVRTARAEVLQFTDAQRAQWADLHARRKGRAHHHGRHRRGEDEASSSARSMLTDTQREIIVLHRVLKRTQGGRHGPRS